MEPLNGWLHYVDPVALAIGFRHFDELNCQGEVQNHRMRAREDMVNFYTRLNEVKWEEDVRKERAPDPFSQREK